MCELTVKFDDYTELMIHKQMIFFGAQNKADLFKKALMLMVVCVEGRKSGKDLAIINKNCTDIQKISF